METRIFFAGLWCHADRRGRLEESPGHLKRQIFPFENIDIEKNLQLLAYPPTPGTPLIQRYEVQGNRYIQILEWDQFPHHTEKESRIPPPLIAKLETEFTKINLPHD
jgi:hypothetical protein